MRASCKITIEYENIDAKSVFGAVSIDDFDFVKSHLEKDKLTAKIESKSISSLLHTLDDYLSCLSVAEKIVNNNND